uniref:Uncharacterized protein n=1 Tax=Coccolithus braarudii TaxID=221442 RepID=A0A6T7CCD0_9EUKA
MPGSCAQSFSLKVAWAREPSYTLSSGTGTQTSWSLGQPGFVAAPWAGMHTTFPASGNFFWHRYGAEELAPLRSSSQAHDGGDGGDSRLLRFLTAIAQPLFGSDSFSLARSHSSGSVSLASASVDWPCSATRLLP